jgi:Ca-activated chloride channel homolog
MSKETMSDAELRATWLRQVQTTPGDFLRAKFAYQASQEGAK